MIISDIEKKWFICSKTKIETQLYKKVVFFYTIWNLKEFKEYQGEKKEHFLKDTESSDLFYECQACSFASSRIPDVLDHFDLYEDPDPYRHPSQDLRSLLMESK